jgi:hypothetical protein
VVLISQACLEQAVFTHAYVVHTRAGRFIQPETDEITQVTFLPDRPKLLFYDIIQYKGFKTEYMDDS